MKLNLNLHTHMIFRGVWVCPWMCLKKIEKQNFEICSLKTTFLFGEANLTTYKEIDKNLKNALNMN